MILQNRIKKKKTFRRVGVSFKVNYYIRVISKLRFLLVVLLFFFSFLFQEGREKWIRITKVVVKSHAFKFVHLNLLSQLSYFPLCTWGGLSSKVTSIITSCSSGQIPKSSYIVYNYSLDETELRAFFCRHYSSFPSFSLPIRKWGIE